jgi:alkaline phosphatase D
MSKSSVLLILVLSSINLTISGQKDIVNAGPMVGYSEMREVMLWAQTTRAAEVSYQYWNTDLPEEKFLTKIKRTSVDEAYTAKIVVSPLEPGQHFEYRLMIDGSVVDLPYKTGFQTLPIWKWRTDPPGFSFAAGSCAYINEEQDDRPGTPYGGGYEIFGSIYEKQPDFMIWLGDNIYYREPDWNSWTGITHRYTHDRAIPEIQPMLGSMHHYAIWDDHDYGPNNSDRGYWFRDHTLEAFELFWANPSYGTEGMPGAITYFNWNDADFFLLDNRYYRSPNDLEEAGKTILGEKQKQWLLDNLVTSNATFKFVVVGGQFLNDEARHETWSNYGFSAERQEIIDFIYQHDIPGIIFLSGDRHFTELSKLEHDAEPVIYDLTISPLTSGPYRLAGEEAQNGLRVPGTLYAERNFGLLNVNGPWKDRRINITVFDTLGNEVWSYQISEKEWLPEK